MPRHVMWQRLNRHPQHRWNMLRNMAMSLFLHQRVVTTYAKAKCLIPLVNNILSKGLRNTKLMHGRVLGIFFNNKKLKDTVFNFYADKYVHHEGGIAKIKKLIKRRKGDNAQLASVELLHNKHSVEEGLKFDDIQSRSGISFSNWEMDIRQKQLDSLCLEKDTRDRIYETIKQKIEEIRAKHPKATKREILQKMRAEFLGSEIKIKQLRHDNLIPQSDKFQLYLKSLINLEDLDVFYKSTNRVLANQIHQCKMQIDLLKKKMLHKTQSRVYEQNNFSRYFTLYNEYEEEYNKLLQRKEYKDETTYRSEIIRYFINERKEENKKHLDKVEKTQLIDNYIKKKGYDAFKLSESQQKDIEDYQLSLKREEFTSTFLNRGNYKSIGPKRYENIIIPNYRNGHEIPVPQEEILPIEQLADLKTIPIEQLKERVSEEKLNNFLEEEIKLNEKKETANTRTQLVELFKHKIDRQVKKKNRLFTNLTMTDIKNTTDPKGMLKKIQNSNRI